MQPAGTIGAMVNTFVWVPVAMVAVMAVLLWFYDFDSRIDGIVADLRSA